MSEPVESPEDAEVSIVFTREEEYSWNGPISDLPESVRKGLVDRSGNVDEDALFDRIDDEIMSELIGSAELVNEQFELHEVGEC